MVSRDVSFHELVFPHKVSGSQAVTYDNVVPTPIIFHDNLYSSDISSPHIISSTCIQSDPLADCDFLPNDSNKSSSHSDSSEHTSVPTSGSVQPVWKSTRARVTPRWPKDYASQATDSTILTSPHVPISYPYIDLVNLDATHVSFLANVKAMQESTTYNQAKGSHEWIHAMEVELEALKANGI
ncbi:hypothetical protein LIER_16006 [Lithospermum erythrorhizon]|uniref:Uncharacterized protein n=1 Tax=Lithospermum erythrorhizon TaxID=34254 RepID=A0AAV3Q529_LITER